MKKNTIPLRRSPLWPALLSGLVAPGVGQIFNRDYFKGIFLLVSSISSFLWFSKVLTERLSTVLTGPPEQWAANQAALREGLIKLINENGEMFLTFQILILLIWGFSVVDAYLTARKRATPPATHENSDAER